MTRNIQRPGKYWTNFYISNHLYRRSCLIVKYLFWHQHCLDNGKATLMVNQITNHLLQLNIDIVDNRNIISKHLSRKGLHLNESGSCHFAINFLERIKKFWKYERYASIVEEDELAICSKTANLSNKRIESEKEKNSQNINLKSLREENLDRSIFAQINIFYKK